MEDELPDTHELKSVFFIIIIIIIIIIIKCLLFKQLMIFKNITIAFMIFNIILMILQNTGCVEYDNESYEFKISHFSINSHMLGTPP